MFTRVTTVLDFVDTQNYAGVFLQNSKATLETQCLYIYKNILFLRRAISCKTRVVSILQLLLGCFKNGSNLNSSIRQGLDFGAANNIKGIVMNIFGKPTLVGPSNHHLWKLYNDWRKPEEKHIPGVYPTQVLTVAKHSAKMNFKGMLLRNASTSCIFQLIYYADNIMLVNPVDADVSPYDIFELLSGCFEKGSNFDREISKVIQSESFAKVDAFVLSLSRVPMMVSRSHRHPNALKAEWERQQDELAGIIEFPS